MTKIQIYPFFGAVSIDNVRKFVEDMGFTIKNIQSNVPEKDANDNNTGPFYSLIEVNQTLTTTQKNTAKDTFKGFAYLKFA